MTNLAASPELDGDIASIAPKITSVAHLDLIIKWTLVLLSTILTATELIGMRFNHTKTSEEAYVSGTVNFIQRKFHDVMELIASSDGNS